MASRAKLFIEALKNKFLNDQQWRITVQPLWYQGILLDTSMKGYFQGVDDRCFEGGHLGVAYTFYASLFTGTKASDTSKLRCPPIRFYLTRPVPPGRNKQLLIEQKRVISELAEMEAQSIKLSRLMENASRCMGGAKIGPQLAKSG